MMQGKVDKYTKYSDVTGITADKGQSTSSFLQNNEVVSMNNDTGHDESIETKKSNAMFEKHIPSLTTIIRKFTIEREWEQYHKPRNLMLALVGELGELAELFLWRNDDMQHLTEQEFDKIEQEIADVMIYLIRLADVCDFPLSVVVL